MHSKIKNTNPPQQTLRGICIGAPDWIRTSGLPGRSRTLYPTELRTRIDNATFQIGVSRI